MSAKATPPPVNFVEIIDTPIDPTFYTQKVLDDEAGAVSTFIGTTRRTNGAHKISSLYYEAYKEMALEEMRSICEELRKQYQVIHIAMVHRLGTVRLQEISIFIAVSAPRRKSAIAACNQAINRFKECVPIWKQEITESGEKLWIANDSTLTL